MMRVMERGLHTRGAMKTHALPLALAAGLIARAPLAAQRSPGGEPLPQLAQELFLAETVYAQERGDVQLTAFTRIQDGTHARLLGEYGITDRLQLSLVTPALEDDPDGEEEAWEPGVLYALLPDASPVAVSVTLDASLAHGQAPRWESALIAARRFGRVQLHGSVGTDLGEPGDVTGTLAALVDAGRLTPTLEGVWASGEDDYAVPGLFAHLARDVEVGVGVPLCIHCAGSPPQQVRAMFTVEF